MLLILFIERWKLLEAKWYGSNHKEVNSKAEEGKKTHIQMFDIVRGKTLFDTKWEYDKSKVTGLMVSDWQLCLMMCIKVSIYSIKETKMYLLLDFMGIRV